MIWFALPVAFLLGMDCCRWLLRRRVAQRLRAAASSGGAVAAEGGRAAAFCDRLAAAALIEDISAVAGLRDREGRAERIRALRRFEENSKTDRGPGAPTAP